MLNIKIICVGKLKERFYEAAVSEYTKRLSAFCRLEIEELNEVKLPQDPSESEITAALSKEGENVKNKIPKGALIIAMCIEGKQADSVEFAQMIQSAAVSGESKMCFIIGGSYGLAKEVKDMAKVKLSMSKMTFPHHLARVMLLEQIYRGFKIAEGGKYHK